MKKYLALTMAACMALSLAACGSSASSTTSSSAAASTEATAIPLLLLKQPVLTTSPHCPVLRCWHPGR